MDHLIIFEYFWIAYSTYSITLMEFRKNDSSEFLWMGIYHSLCRFCLIWIASLCERNAVRICSKSLVIFIFFKCVLSIVNFLSIPFGYLYEILIFGNSKKITKLDLIGSFFIFLATGIIFFKNWYLMKKL